MRKDKMNLSVSKIFLSAIFTHNLISPRLVQFAGNIRSYGLD